MFLLEWQACYTTQTAKASVFLFFLGAAQSGLVSPAPLLPWWQRRHLPKVARLLTTKPPALDSYTRFCAETPSFLVWRNKLQHFSEPTSLKSAAAARERRVSLTSSATLRCVLDSHSAALFFFCLIFFCSTSETTLLVCATGISPSGKCKGKAQQELFAAAAMQTFFPSKFQLLRNTA